MTSTPKPTTMLHNSLRIPSFYIPRWCDSALYLWIGLAYAEPMMETQDLTKGSFLQAVRCHKLLYLDRFHPDWSEPLDAPTRRRLKEGERVHELAREFFPEGVDVRADDPLDLEASLLETGRMLDEGREVLFEAAVRERGVFTFIDVLARENGSWTLYEVKSSTGLKDHYLWDIALQIYLLEGGGQRVNDAYLVHLDRDYRRDGPVEAQKLFVKTPMLELCRELLPEVEEHIEEAKAILHRGAIPPVDIGPYCDEPYECRFKGYCWQHIPDPSVFDVYYLPKGKKFDLYDQGVLRIEDIPDGYPMQARSAFHVKHHKRRDTVIDRSALADFLDGLQYPLHFLDFETYSTAIPPYDGVGPYEQIPFQWSLHLVPEPGAEPVHHGFLAEPGLDPRRPLAEALLNQLEGTGDIVAFFSSFEKRILGSLAEALPDLADPLRDYQERLVDLREPFAQRHLYLPEMEGSASIKAILPAVVPDVGYEDLEVTEGEEASETFLRWSETQDPEEAQRLRDALWDYCTVDTLGMVEILRVIERVSEEPRFIP